MCPMLAPMGTLTDARRRALADRLGSGSRAHAARWREHAAEIADKVREVHRRGPADGAATDPDRMLYSGGFFSDAGTAREMDG
jgi:exonuclease I